MFPSCLLKVIPALVLSGDSLCFFWGERPGLETAPFLGSLQLEGFANHLALGSSDFH